MTKPKVGQLWSFVPRDSRAGRFQLRISHVDADGIEVSDPDDPTSLKRMGFSTELWAMMVAGAETTVSEPS